MNVKNWGALDQLHPTVNFASYAEGPPGTEWGPRYIPDYQLFYVVSGTAQIQLGEYTYRLEEGHCILLSPDCPHRIVLLKQTRFFSMHFHWNHESAQPVHPAYHIRKCSLEELQGTPPVCILELTGQAPIAVPTYFSFPGLKACFTAIVQEYLNERPGFAWALRGLLIGLLTEIIRQILVTAPQSASSSKLEPALQAIRQFPERNWTVTQLAGLCGYHSIYFTSLFKEMIGLVPKQYLIAERIRLAKYYILNGDKLEIVAERLGYSSIHYFSRNFKKETGLSPSDFRQQGQGSLPLQQQ